MCAGINPDNWSQKIWILFNNTHAHNRCHIIGRLIVTVYTVTKFQKAVGCKPIRKVLCNFLPLPIAAKSYPKCGRVPECLFANVDIHEYQSRFVWNPVSFFRNAATFIKSPLLLWKWNETFLSIASIIIQS